MENTLKEWLRCNACYRSMKKSTRTFSLTQCQHVFCNACIAEVEKECPECKSVGVKTVPLVEPLPQALQHYFGRVGTLLNQCLEASRFQRTQRLIAFRRFDNIQEKYESMKRTYYQGAEQMKSLTAAYIQKKEEHAKLVASIEELQSEESKSFAGSTNPNASVDQFMSPAANHRVQQSKHMTDCGMGRSQTRINASSNDTGPSSLNSSRSSITTPYMEQQSRYPVQHRVTQSACHNRHQTELPEYRYHPVAQIGDLKYPSRATFSNFLPPKNEQRRFDNGSASRNRIPGSLERSSSSRETIRNSPMVIDNDFKYRRS